MTNPILVTGAAGAVGYAVCDQLVKRGCKVRAMVRKADERSARLAERGVEIVVGDLLDLHATHRAIEGCDRVYFGMSVSPSYLEATINATAVARHHKVDAFVNISQMTVSQMGITSTTDSPQQKLHWLAEQALNWSELPVVHIRPTAFLDTFFLRLSMQSIRQHPSNDGRGAGSQETAAQHFGICPTACPGISRRCLTAIAHIRPGEVKGKQMQKCKCHNRRKTDRVLGKKGTD